MLSHPSGNVAAGTDLFAEIDRLRQERRAVILAHYYQDSDIQDIADYVGDSLGLSQAAAATDAEVIVFAGVHFMAETAKTACAGQDRCCCLTLRPAAAWPTAALRCVRGLPGPVPGAQGGQLHQLFGCDEGPERCHLHQQQCREDRRFVPARAASGVRAGPISRRLGRRGSWGGSSCCGPARARSTRPSASVRLVELKGCHPAAVVAAHPECPPAVLQHADYVGSTTGILEFARSTEARQVIVVTEPGILHRMQRENPDKELIPVPGADESCSCNECPYMKKNTLEKLYLCLRDGAPEITLDPALAGRARAPIARMLELSR